LLVFAQGYFKGISGKKSGFLLDEKMRGGVFYAFLSLK